MRNKKSVITGIYKISNILDDRKYIGSAKNIHNRWRVHKCELRKNEHSNRKLQNWVNKYSINYLIFEVIEVCTEEMLLIREQWYLDNVIDWKNDWNICKVAGSSLGTKHSEESKAKMSQAHKGKKCSQGTLDACSIPVAQYDLYGIFIRKWSSAKEASRNLDIHDNTINTCRKGRCASAGGFMWKYYTTDDNIEPYNINNKKAVTLIDSDNNIIKKFDSVKEAAKQLNVSEGNIWSVCKGKRKHTKGYRFKYLTLTK